MPMEVHPDRSTVTSWEPGRRLALRTPSAPDGSFQAFEYRIEARGQGSAALRFVHNGFTSDDWGDEYDVMTSSGWDMYFHTLGQYLTHFAGRPAVYLQAESPPASAKAEAAPRLVPPLPLTDPVQAGSA